MKKCLYFFVAITSFALMQIGCTIAPPKLELTGEKSIVEKQLVGNYREIEDNAWTVSNVMTNAQKKKGEGANVIGDPQLYSAMKVREFNINKVRSYKNEGAIGETYDGYLEYRSVEKYDTNPDAKKLLMILINDENAARKTIFTRSLAMTGNTDPSEVDIEAFGKKFAGEQQKLAEENQWLQNNNGIWYRKK